MLKKFKRIFFPILFLQTLYFQTSCKEPSKNSSTPSSQQAMNTEATNPQTIYLELAASPLPPVDPSTLQVSGTATGLSLGSYTYLSLEFTNDQNADAVYYKISGANNFSNSATTSLPLILVNNLPQGSLNIVARSCVRESRSTSKETKYLVQDPLNPGVNFYCNDKIFPMRYQNAMVTDSALAALFAKEQAVDKQIRVTALQVFNKLKAYVSQSSFNPKNSTADSFVANIVAFGPDYFVDWVDSPEFEDALQSISAQMGGESTGGGNTGNFDPTAVYLALLSIGAVTIATTEATSGGLGLVEEGLMDHVNRFSAPVYEQIVNILRVRGGEISFRNVREFVEANITKLEARIQEAKDPNSPKYEPRVNRFIISEAERWIVDDRKAFMLLWQKYMPPLLPIEQKYFALHQALIEKKIDLDDYKYYADFLLNDELKMVDYWNDQALKASGSEKGTFKKEALLRIKGLLPLLENQHALYGSIHPELKNQIERLTQIHNGSLDLHEGFNQLFHESNLKISENSKAIIGTFSSVENFRRVQEGRFNDLIPKVEPSKTKAKRGGIFSIIAGFVGGLFSHLAGKLHLADTNSSWNLIFDQAAIIKLVNLKTQAQTLANQIAAQLVSLQSQSK